MHRIKCTLFNFLNQLHSIFIENFLTLWWLSSRTYILLTNFLLFKWLNSRLPEWSAWVQKWRSSFFRSIMWLLPELFEFSEYLIQVEYKLLLFFLLARSDSLMINLEQSIRYAEHSLFGLSNGDIVFKRAPDLFNISFTVTIVHVELNANLLIWVKELFVQLCPDTHCVTRLKTETSGWCDDLIHVPLIVLYPMLLLCHHLI